MALEEYKRKRRFEETPEPPPKVESKSGHRFVVQKHDATRLHYDFRLEMEGVLKSWAVPKGPCLDPAEKRLAVHVEDHPLEYAAFEGIIPKGEYGGGTVIVWDQGTWAGIEGDALENYRQGKLKFRLAGEKLRGAWMLVRLRPREGEKADNWLLFKERDAEARPLAEFDVLQAQPESALSGQTVEEVAKNPPRVWHSRQGVEDQEPPPKPQRRRSARVGVPTSRIAQFAPAPASGRRTQLTPSQLQ